MNDAMTKLLSIMAQLRDPVRGCPWDREQTYSSIIPYTLEETYEVVDCVERSDYDHLREELGDLLFQVVFLARIAEEQGRFSFDDVANGISEKLLRRHPHVFGDAVVESQEDVKKNWEQIKQQERDQKNQGSAIPKSVLDDVEATHPALTHAGKLQKTAAKVGFDWPSVEGVFDKLDEEIAELKEALRGEDRSAVEHEMGDVLFAGVNLARHVKINPETALRNTNYRFIRRFQKVEALASAQSKKMQDLTLDEMESLWQQAKRLDT